MYKFYDQLLNLFLVKLIPQSKKSIKKGNKIFSGAIINKKNQIITLGTNNETLNPLFHGEIVTLNQYFKNKYNYRNTKDYIFISSHEPCSLCLSAITWSGFKKIYYFFPYSDTKNKFKIPHDLKILKEVFKISDGNYNKSNKYWNSYSILDEIKKLKNDEIIKLEKKIKIINKEYKYLSKLYQDNKKINIIPLK
ncbi:MAG: tRNA-specific adenosine deaminase [Alphaproteobacteria bacterium MarineAlpha5_Bin9]|nr:MAG: tRNA-specific adenosine deaminase [Alphaproteobacteria bacterium MarineAlpha5_Bin9]|tara:strand:- start:1984 stop:2565 length:582 start_codon:yes stop_codon:yes gene_type:complete